MKTVLITGAAKGIGRAAAIAFAKAGYNVAVHYNTSRQAADQLAQIIWESYSVGTLAVQADVTDPAQVQAMTEAVKLHFGSIDVLVNNGGIAQQKLFTDITTEDWNRMLAVNLSGAFYCCKAVLPDMISRKAGSVINISSMWGQVGASCEVHYSAAKAGVIGLTKALAKEVAPSQIRVNCIAPGVVNTDMMQGFSDDDLQTLKEETPLGRIGTPKEIADTAVFLASGKAAFITGQVIGVNGGMVI